MSSSNSPCAACKFTRRKCIQECVFAPYFPPDQPQKFSNVHKVFGASNVAKLLNELSANLREDAVNSLAYEAEARLRDPVYGCVGLISILQHRLKQVQTDLYNAKKELATYVGPQAMLPILPSQALIPQQPMVNQVPATVQAQQGMFMGMGGGGGQLMIREQQQIPQQIFDAQQLAAAVAVREQQEMMRNFEQQQEILRFNTNSNGFDGGAVTPTGFNNNVSGGSPMSPSLGLGGSFDNPFQIHQPDQHPHTLQPQLMTQQSQPQPPPQPPSQTQHHLQQQQKTDEGRSVAPSC